MTSLIFACFLLVNLELIKHDTCNGLLKSGTRKRKMVDILSDVFLFCPKIPLPVFTVICGVSMVHYQSIIRKICFHFGGKRLRNPLKAMKAYLKDPNPLGH